MFGIISKSSTDGAIAGMAQSVEHVIGNDEVISSILITSSNKATQSGCFIFFVLRQIMNKKKKAQAFANRKSFVLFYFLIFQNCIHSR